MIVFSPRKLTFPTKPHTFLLSWTALIVFVFSRFSHVAMMETENRERLTLKRSTEKKNKTRKEHRLGS